MFRKVMSCSVEWLVVVCCVCLCESGICLLTCRCCCCFSWTVPTGEDPRPCCCSCYLSYEKNVVQSFNPSILLTWTLDSRTLHFLPMRPPTGPPTLQLLRSVRSCRRWSRRYRHLKSHTCTCTVTNPRDTNHYVDSSGVLLLKSLWPSL